jgi:flagellar FliJ protein
MAQFKFKLETVLKVKARIEDLRKRELQVAEVEREKAKKQLLQRQDEVVDTLNTYRNTCRQKLDLYLANNYHKFLIWQNKQVELADQYLGVCNHNVVDKRQELVAASREKKTVEKLKEKAFEAYKAEELNLEIKFLDELGTGQFIRHNEDIKEETQK